MNIQTLADGLSEAQREDILEANADDPFCPCFSRLYADDRMLPLIEAYPAHHDPDCPPDEDGGTRWSFTPLGQQVRDYLENSDGK